MTETPPPYRQFVCRICGKTFAPPPEEAEALAELERAFGLPAASAVAVCGDHGKTA